MEWAKDRAQGEREGQRGERPEEDLGERCCWEGEKE